VLEPALVLVVSLLWGRLGSIVAGIPPRSQLKNSAAPCCSKQVQHPVAQNKCCTLLLMPPCCVCHPAACPAPPPAGLGTPARAVPGIRTAHPVGAGQAALLHEPAQPRVGGAVLADSSATAAAHAAARRGGHAAGQRMAALHPAVVHHAGARA